MRKVKNIWMLILLVFSIALSAQTTSDTPVTEDSIPTVELNEFVVKASTIVNNPQGYL